MPIAGCPGSRPTRLRPSAAGVGRQTPMPIAGCPGNAAMSAPARTEGMMTEAPCSKGECAISLFFGAALQQCLDTPVCHCHSV